MEGYAKLALLMGRHDEVAIFRRFQTLNMQNLLYMQAELAQLEDDLKKLARDDIDSPDRIYYAKDWWSLSQSPEDKEKIQWNKCLDIRKKLKEYNDALAQAAELSKAAVPKSHDLEFLRSWLVRPSMGNFPLLGLDSKSYEPEHMMDLMTFNSRPSPDLFSHWFVDKLVPAWHKVLGRKVKSTTSEDLGSGLYNYNESQLSAILGVATTVVASMLPMCSVVLLYIAQSDTLRLGLVIMASGIFALALALMTSARKVEVFAATSAFAAVNVVFLTNQSTIATQVSS
ncbi:putative DUF6594 domain-containing protein [Seiridium cardinale]